MATTTFEPELGTRTDYVPYRVLHPLAVASLAGGVLSVTAFLGWALAVIPALAILLGLRGWWRVRSAPEEYTGAGLAQFGIVLAVACWASGWSWLSYVYATEVPEGYQRIDYAELQPEEGQPPTTIPASALALNGKRVFIKGYIYPPNQLTGVTRFVLCRDNGDCCFGGKPKLTDMIDVSLQNDLSLNYSRKLHRLAGVFRVSEAGDPEARGAVYRLEADYLK